MKNTKIQIFIALLFMVIGIAAVTTNLIINGSTNISSNQDDFLVYFSNVLVNGTQDLSVVKSEKELVFNSEFSAVGDKVTLDYDVTNASKNYDATISISCTESNNYLNVTNNFDQKSNLLARSTRTGTLTVELINAVSQETSYEVKCTITGTAVERETQGSGDVKLPLSGKTYSIGEEISIGNEKFNVIRDNGDTITMLAKYNLGTNYLQTSTPNQVSFSEYWNSEELQGTTGSIDLTIYGTIVNEYLTNYKTKLSEETGTTNIEVSLLDYDSLLSLDCKENGYHAISLMTCDTSIYSSWLNNNQKNWLLMFHTVVFGNVDPYYIEGLTIAYQSYSSTAGIRPTITISKSSLPQTTEYISFTLDGKTYTMPEGSTWANFIDSDINDTVAKYDEFEGYIYDDDEAMVSRTIIYNPEKLILEKDIDTCDAYTKGKVFAMTSTDLIVDNGDYVIGYLVCII